MLQKLVGEYLVGVAGVVALWIIFGSLVVSPEVLGQVWDIIDYFMAVAMVIALIASIMRLRSSGITALRPKLELLFTVFALLLFFGTWIHHLQGESVEAFTWLVVDSVFVVVAAGVGFRVFSGEPEQSDA